MKKNSVEIVGHITLPNAPIKHKCVCDECGNEVSDRFGDQRIEILIFDFKESKIPSSKKVCTYCAETLFGDICPYSVFG